MRLSVWHLCLVLLLQLCRDRLAMPSRLALLGCYLSAFSTGVHVLHSPFHCTSFVVVVIRMYKNNALGWKIKETLLSLESACIKVGDLCAFRLFTTT